MFLIFLSILFSYEILELEVFGASIAGLLASYLSVLKQSLDYDRVFMELFVSFNSRYNNEINDIFNRIRIYESTGLAYTVNEIEMLSIIDYMNLCSEEYFWYSKGRIPKKIWKAWEHGIIANLSLQEVRMVFEKETNSQVKEESYYGFAAYIRPKLSGFSR
jgi:hypothetical protein